MERTRLALAGALLGVVIVACSPGTAASPSPAASADPAAPRIAARDIKFDRSELTVPAGTPFTLVFENQEAAPHNVAITAPDGGAPFTGEVFQGPARRDYAVPALAPGAYRFLCTVHPTMTGTLTAG